MEYTLTITSNDASELAALLSGISGGSALNGTLRKAPAASGSSPEPERVTAGAKEGSDSNDSSSKKITKEELRELTTQKAQADAGNPAKIKAILKKLGGATQVANLAEEHYASYHKQVSAL